MAAIRELSTVDELALVAPLCRAVWGDDDEPESRDLLVAMVHEGALCAGAFDGRRLVGYVFGFRTADPAVMHSHRLAVHPDQRGTGLGLALKRFQGEWCLARGMTAVRWTYDPARLINARLNIERLGAVGVSYLPDYYGVMTGINAGAVSDRLLAEWRLAAPPASRPDRHDDDVLVELPADFAALLRSDPASAAVWRRRHRAELLPLLDDGWEVVGVEPCGEHDGRSSWAYRVRRPAGGPVVTIP